MDKLHHLDQPVITSQKNKLSMSVPRPFTEREGGRVEQGTQYESVPRPFTEREGVREEPGA